MRLVKNNNFVEVADFKIQRIAEFKKQGWVEFKDTPPVSTDEVVKEQEVTTIKEVVKPIPQKRGPKSTT